MAMAASAFKIPPALPSRKLRKCGSRHLILSAAAEGSSGGWMRRVAAAGAVVAVAAAVALTANSADRMRSAREYTRRGMELFIQGDVEGSLESFDRALESYPDGAPYLWQRGLSLFYVNRFEEGAAQFREDMKLRSNDAEEALWCFLCEAQVYGVEEARKRMPSIGKDGRPYMYKIYELFERGGDPQKILLDVGSNNSQAYFYTALYAGLYEEANKNIDAARAAIVSACQSPYGAKSEDYMAYVAKVHCNSRNWEYSS